MSDSSRTKGRYPLEPLRLLRRQASEQTAQEVAEEARRRRSAEHRVDQVQGSRATAEQAVDKELESERRRLQEGLLRVADLQSADQFRRAAEQRLGELRGAEATARAELLERASAEAGARAELHRAHAAERAVDEHREQWQRQQARKQELVLEDEVASSQPSRGKGPVGANQ